MGSKLPPMRPKVRLSSTVEWSAPLDDLTVDELRDFVAHLEGADGDARVHITMRNPFDQRDRTTVTLKVDKLEA